MTESPDPGSPAGETPGWKHLFALFLASQSVSLFGSSLVQYAIVWYITLETNSGSMMALSIILGFLPAFFLSPFAGVWADRFNRKYLIIGADVGIALASLLLFCLFRLGDRSVWLLLVISMIRAIGYGCPNPASARSSQIVRKPACCAPMSAYQRQSALPWYRAGQRCLMNYLSVEVMFLTDVVTCIFAVLIFLFIKVMPIARRRRKNGQLLAGSSLGFSYIRNHTYVAVCFGSLPFFRSGHTGRFSDAAPGRPHLREDVWRLTAIR
jgi:DHA3 family macrolide efflux protein-like MFS transporter